MTGWILVILVFMVGMLAWTSAIKQALLGTSDGALERRLAELGRLERSRWIIGRQRSLASYLAVKCAAQSALITGVVVLDLCGIGEGAVLDPWRLTFSVLIATVLIWFSTGVIGPALARYIGSGLITAILPLLRLALPIMGPFARITSVFDESVRRLTGANLLERDAEEELLRSIEDSQRKGGLDDVAVEMLENVVEFADTDVSSVMTPRTDIDGIAFTDELSEIRSFIESAGHSRIPVYSENLDSIEGILYVKDLVRYLGEDAASFRLRPLLREAIRVPETKQVGDLLRDFQSAEIHMAIVIDEYGGTSGLVTIEDVLEEIVGEIHDEHEPDDEEEATCLPLSEGLWQADGRFPLQDLEDHLPIELPEELEPETLAGFVLEHFGRVPAIEESFEDLGYRFTVLEASETKVDLIRIQQAAAPAADADGLIAEK